MAKHIKDDYQLNGLLDHGCDFDGKLVFEGTVQINGNFRGEIVSDGTLIVGSEAHVEANVKVDGLVVEGNVRGVIEAKKIVELRRGCRLIANITTPSLVIEEGAVFHGESNMIDINTSTEKIMHASPKEIFGEDREDSLMM